MTDSIVVLITAPNEEVSATISDDILNSQLAACVNIIRGVRSLYRWQGKVEDEGEVLMIVKTRQELFQDLEKRVKELHPYTVPEIIALPLIEGSEAYLGWLREETRPAQTME